MRNPDFSKGLQFTIAGGGVLLLCALSFFYLDRRAVDFFLAIDPQVVRIFHAITQLGDALYPLSLGVVIYLFCRLRQRLTPHSAVLECWKQRALFLIFAVASSGLLTDLLKFIFGRARPAKLLTENLYGFYLFETSSRMTSFPSGHSNTAAAVALVLWYIWPKSWPLGLLLTAAVMLSRVVVLKHYPSDTLAGAYLAVVTTYYVFHFFQRRVPGALGRGEG